MTTGTQEFASFGESTETKLLQLMEDVDATRGAFFLASDRYRSLPTESYLDRLANAAENSEDAVRDAIRFILGDVGQESPETIGQMIATLINDDGLKRSAHFKKLVGNDFKNLSFERKNFSEYIAEMLVEDPDEVGIMPNDGTEETIMDIYDFHIEQDIDRFVRAVGETKNAKTVKVAGKVGKHALNFAVAGSAAALGSWLVMRKQNK